MTTGFKEGDRVRLKAWVKELILKGSEKSFPQGCVGIVSTKVRHLYGTPYLDLQSPLTKRNHLRAFVAVEDLELMPERQVHIVKDGKVYELRKKEPSLPSCNSCDIMTSSATCPTPCPGYYNYKEVKSGKLVS